MATNAGVRLSVSKLYGGTCKSTMQNPYPQITQIPQMLKRHLPNSAQLRKESLNNQCSLRNLRIAVSGVLQEALW
jgi:hypothetical protein